jgi:hypothetical protein
MTLALGLAQQRGATAKDNSQPGSDANAHAEVSGHFFLKPKKNP